jgi:hypothetical protein
MPMHTKEEQRRYQREWIARRRREWFDENGPCVDCGSQENLELDHVDPTIKVDHKVWSWTKIRREIELAKCMVRCESCHLKRTIQQLTRNICSRGHDKYVTGRDTDGSCAECRRENQRRYRNTNVH